MARLLEHLGDVEQRFRRDAAAVDADATGILLLVDEGDLHAEIGGQERGGITAGTGADDRDVDGVRH
jgi:hypothetical protein